MYVDLTKFSEYGQIEKTMFALWALQNPNEVNYDIVYALPKSKNKLAMVFYTDASTWFYFDPTQNQLDYLRPELERTYIANCSRSMSCIILLYDVLIE